MITFKQATKERADALDRHNTMLVAGHIDVTEYERRVALTVAYYDEQIVHTRDFRAGVARTKARKAAEKATRDALRTAFRNAP